MSDIQTLFVEVAVSLMTSIITILTTPLLPVLITDRVTGGTLFENLRAALITSLTRVIILGKRMRIPIDRKIGKASEPDR